MSKKGLQLDEETYAELGYGNQYEAVEDILVSRSAHYKAEKAADANTYKLTTGKEKHHKYMASYHQRHKGDPEYRERRRVNRAAYRQRPEYRERKKAYRAAYKARRKAKGE